MDLPPLTIDRSAGRPLGVQLADGIRGAAMAGSLRPGDRLPSTRSLAAELGVSRTVCATAYDQLLAEGWLAARPGSGTFVVGVPGALPNGPQPPFRATLTAPAVDGRAGGADTRAITLRAGLPCLDAIDRPMWRRAWRVAADAPIERSADREGLPAFRAVVVELL